MTERTSQARRRNRQIGFWTAVAAVFMVGMSFAAVPLYDVFCRVTGFGGTTQVADIAPASVLDRTVTVRFTADSDPDLPWEFNVTTRSVDVQLGEPALVYYTARNVSDLPVAATAVYNVNPLRTGIYFNKVECFCFDEQIIGPGEEVEFPVYFFVDPAMDEDRRAEDVETITLSYTFFPTTSEALDRAVEEYYRSVEEANTPGPLAANGAR